MDHTQLCFAFYGLAVTERGLSFLMCSDVSLLFAVVCPSFLLSTTTNWYIPSSTLMAPWHQRAQFAPYIRRCRPTTPVHPEFKDLRLHQTTTHNKWGCWGGGCCRTWHLCNTWCPAMPWHYLWSPRCYRCAKKSRIHLAKCSPKRPILCLRFN